MDKKKRLAQFNQICKDIKNVKIQGARNIAKAGLKAYSLIQTKTSKEKLLSLRPSEPMLEKVLVLTDKIAYNKIIDHFNQAQETINKHIFKLIKNNDIIFTYCHSTNVVNALVYSKKHGRKFQVYNTETRPLLQGRKTAKELRKAKIKVAMFVDSALGVALEGKQGIKKTTKVLLGADALLKKGIINKIGSNVIAQIAKNNKIPVYIVADSWKYTNKNVPLENRTLNEIWNKAPKLIKIQNPAFEFVHKKYIKKIITELGVLSYDGFLKRVKNNH